MLLSEVSLDPRYKLRHIRFCYSQIYESGNVDELVRRLIETTKNMFEYYQKIDSLATLNSSKKENKIEMGVEKPSGDYEDTNEEGDDDDEGHIKEECSELLLHEEHGWGVNRNWIDILTKVLNQLVKSLIFGGGEVKSLVSK